MTDSAAALVDERMRAPRQGDGDDGRAVLLDAPVPGGGWPALLALSEALFGRLGWWPQVTAGVASTLIGDLAGAPRDIPGRPGQRPSRFPDAGVTLLRTDSGPTPEIWCRLDGGPHGFLSIAAHAHADAMSVEVRYGGVDVLADPGTYCYHGEPAWRSYFRSTIAHNTIELCEQSQSGEGGPFLWLRHANGHEIGVIETGEGVEWTADHDGYLSLRPPARHRRSVRLDRAARRIEIVDEIEGGRIRLSGLPSTWDPRSRWSSMAAARSCAGTPRPPPGKHGWSCRRGCSGACTVARPIPSSAGTRPVWESGCPRSRFSAPVGLPRARLSPPGWSSSTEEKRKNGCLPGQLYHSGPRILS